MTDDPQNKSAPLAVSKIPPYPIAVEIFMLESEPSEKGNPPKKEKPMKGSIVKMTDIGFLMKVETIRFYKVGETFIVQFRLPVVNADVRCQGKVVKTYDAVESIVAQGTSQKVEKLYTVEIHFKNIIAKEKTAIHSYLIKSGQKKF